MIPKIIHYCWFGTKSLPEVEQRCIQSWKKFFPDYKFMFWNELTFDITSSVFARQAYEAKKYAFVSDYVRVKVLEQYGGIYFDTDYEVLKSFDEILGEGYNVVGFENKSRIGTAFLAFEPHHPIVKDFLSYYDTHPFMDEKGNIDMTANIVVLTDMLLEKGVECIKDIQIVEDVKVYPREYFYPKKVSEGEFNVFPETMGMHRFSCSWLSDKQKKRGNSWFWLNCMRPLLKYGRAIGLTMFGKERVRSLEIKIRNILK